MLYVHRSLYLLLTAKLMRIGCLASIRVMHQTFLVITTSVGSFVKQVSRSVGRLVRGITNMY